MIDLRSKLRLNLDQRARELGYRDERDLDVAPCHLPLKQIVKMQSEPRVQNQESEQVQQSLRQSGHLLENSILQKELQEISRLLQ